MRHCIYLDNSATTPIDPRVTEAMLPWLSHQYGNASSLHSFGTVAKDHLEDFRYRLASLIGANSDEIVFTGSGTESNNFALKGIAFANRSKGDHIIVSSIEHDCILHTAQWLETQGFRITYLPVDSQGLVNPEDVKKHLTTKTILVSIMHANNEIGTIQPIAEIARYCNEYGVLFHSDACQSFGKIPLNVNAMKLDLLTLNAHKIYGPKGVGALYIRKGTRITPLLHGGGQESGLRSSTENIAGIAGFIKAAELCQSEIANETTRLTALRDKLIHAILTANKSAYLNGHPHLRLPNNANIGIEGLEGETIRLLLLLDAQGFAVSAGSACSSNDKSGGASHVLQSIGLNPFQSRGSIRISLGRFTTETDIDRFTECFLTQITKLHPIFAV